MLKKGDIIIIAAVLIAAAFIYFTPTILNDKGDAKTLIIRVEGEEYRRVDLNDPASDQVIEIEGKYKNVIEIKSGHAAFIASDCPNKDCVRMGHIGDTRAFAACLPNFVSISVVSDTVRIDTVAG